MIKSCEIKHFQIVLYFFLISLIFKALIVLYLEKIQNTRILLNRKEKFAHLIVLHDCLQAPKTIKQ